MKTKILLVLILFLPVFLYSQESLIQDTSDVISVTPPEFVGIENAGKLFNHGELEEIGDYLNKNIEYPEEAASCYMEGTAIVQFIVTADGELTDFKVINSVCPIIDAEFIRVLNATSGMWKPGLNNEKPVEMEKEVSMMFVASQANRKAPKEYFKKLATNYWKKGNEMFLEKHNSKRAIKRYDEVIKYFPYDGSALLVRGLCKYELGDKEGALGDWERINRIGSFDAGSYIEKLAVLKGYDEMMATIEK